MSLSRLGHQVSAKGNTIARGRPASDTSTFPISIRIGCQLVGAASKRGETIAGGAADVVKNTLHKEQMISPRIMHMKTNLLHCIRDVCPSESKVFKTSFNTTILSGIGDMITGLGS
jgi:hypothetical protein